jgi:hypothetical protein
MPILVLLAWLIALSCFIYLAAELRSDRAFERREKKAAVRTIQEFKKHHHYDGKRGKWVRNIDSVVLPRASDDLPRSIAMFGYFVLVLWEVYWVSRIATTPNLSQVPILFSIVVMVGVPLTIHVFSRRILWPSTQLS